jgi:hypothetical protein
MSYGIPVDSMPISIDGVEENSNILLWIEERRNKEQNPDAPSSTTEDPWTSPDDTHQE